MYVCICNAIRDRDIARVARGGATTVDGAYAALGARPACGHCFEEAEMVIVSATQAGRQQAVPEFAD